MGYIVAAGGEPFRDRDAAELKRRLLAAELDLPFAVVEHPSGGFAVVRRALPAATSASVVSARRRENPRDVDAYRVAPSPPDALDRAAAETDAQARARVPRSSSNPATRCRPSASGTDADTSARRVSNADAAPAARHAFPPVLRLKPAPRAFVIHHLVAAIGVWFMVRPQSVLELAADGALKRPGLAAGVLIVIVGVGLAIFLLATARFLWAYLANTYTITPEAVQQTEWYVANGRLRRRTPRVNFAHVRSIDTDQGLMQLCLGVGHLLIASGGTDGHEVALRHVARPRALCREIQRRCRRAGAHATRGRDRQ